MHTHEWLHSNDSRRPRADQVKIREGVYVIQNMLKAPGGLIRVTAVNEDGILKDVHLSGDFFFYPAESLPALEKSLHGIAADLATVAQFIENFYAQNKIESPGVQPMDIAKILVPAAN